MNIKELLKDKKKLGITVVVLLVVIGIVYFIVANQAKNKQALEALENEEIIPTVDASVIVELKAAKKAGEVTLTVKDAPKGTKSIEYELTYDAMSTEGTGEKVPQGAIGRCYNKSGTQNWNCKQQQESGEAITLGTCSSGTCVYHKVVGPIKVTLSFEGSYGKRIFEKEYDL
jgi:hypothetical protein